MMGVNIAPGMHREISGTEVGEYCISEAFLQEDLKKQNLW